MARRFSLAVANADQGVEAGTQPLNAFLVSSNQLNDLLRCTSLPNLQTTSPHLDDREKKVYSICDLNTFDDLPIPRSLSSESPSESPTSSPTFKKSKLNLHCAKNHSRRLTTAIKFQIPQDLENKPVC